MLRTGGEQVRKTLSLRYNCDLKDKTTLAAKGEYLRARVHNINTYKIYVYIHTCGYVTE